ncbi:unnamed protein product [Paramecium primaurelia]|uniref:Transmembrane protein n=1 Tax=Paramecium primaurelia TaxID=5886 RepID=A0A8S1KVH4_PARPR|nr:unnamed protein product [Paramecium primaurelia]
MLTTKHQKNQQQQRPCQKLKQLEFVFTLRLETEEKKNHLKQNQIQQKNSTLLLKIVLTKYQQILIKRKKQSQNLKLISLNYKWKYYNQIIKYALILRFLQNLINQMIIINFMILYFKQINNFQVINHILQSLILNKNHKIDKFKEINSFRRQTEKNQINQRHHQFKSNVINIELYMLKSVNQFQKESLL